MHLGDKAVASVGLAVTGPDGFVSLDGVQGDKRQRIAFSEMVTRSFTFSGDRLYLNLRSALRQWGAGPCEVRAEIVGPTTIRLPAMVSTRPIPSPLPGRLKSLPGTASQI